MRVFGVEHNIFSSHSHASDVFCLNIFFSHSGNKKLRKSISFCSEPSDQMGRIGREKMLQKSEGKINKTKIGDEDGWDGEA